MKKTSLILMVLFFSVSLLSAGKDFERKYSLKSKADIYCRLQQYEKYQYHVEAAR